ncbi:hypothetical protein ERJ75_001715100 [Trypanosoma vivax]|nr:hypothetical protein ERJ75_001715100 [Trypanosoma vivax]
MAVARPAKRRATERCGRARLCKRRSDDGTRRSTALAASDPRRLASASGRRRRSALCASRPSRSRAPTTRTVKAGVRCGGRGRAHGQPRRRHSTEREAAAVGSCRLCEANSGLKALDVGEEARNRTRLPAPRKADRTREEGLRRAARERRRRCVDAVGRRGRNKATAVRERTTHTRADTAGQERTEAATHRGGAHADAAGSGKGTRGMCTGSWGEPRHTAWAQEGGGANLKWTTRGEEEAQRNTVESVHKGSVKMHRVALSAMLACGLALALWSLPALASNGQGKALSEDKVAVSASFRHC